MKEMVGGCCVCSDERGWPENPLVYCDGQNCTVAVHQACYGIVTVPTGPWYCRKCESQERPARVRCELCPSRDGALKRTDNQGWAHVVCALYIPEVRFGNVSTMEPIILQLIPSERYSKTCYICADAGKASKSTSGACMQCNKSGCRQQFHVTCAQQHGLLCEEAGNYLDNVKYCGYCQHHYSKLKKGGNVKPIPPYKPISHDTNSSDSPSSPEKEDAHAKASIRPTEQPGATSNSSSSSSSSSKQKKSSSSGSSKNNSSNAQIPYTSSSNTTNAVNVPAGGSSSSSTRTSSSSSKEKEKDKESKHSSSSSKSVNKISSSTNNKDQSYSSSSYSTSSSRDKNKSSSSTSSSKNSSSQNSSNKDDGASSNSHSSKSSSQYSSLSTSSTIRITTTSATATSPVSTIIQKHESSNPPSSTPSKENNSSVQSSAPSLPSAQAQNDDKAIGSWHHQSNNSKISNSYSSNVNSDAPNNDNDTNKTNYNAMTKKRKAMHQANSSNRNSTEDPTSSKECKDLSVKVIPLDKLDPSVSEFERHYKKARTDINPQTAPAAVISSPPEPNIQNVNPNVILSTGSVAAAAVVNNSSITTASVPSPATSPTSNKSQVIQHGMLANKKEDRPQAESLVVSVPLSSATVPGIQLPTNSISNNLSVSTIVNTNQATTTSTTASLHQGTLYQHLTNSQAANNQRASPHIQQPLGRASPIAPTPNHLANDISSHSANNHSSVLQNMNSSGSNSGSVISSTGFQHTVEPVKVPYEKPASTRIQAIQQEETGRRSRSQTQDNKKGRKRNVHESSTPSSSSSNRTTHSKSSSHARNHNKTNKSNNKNVKLNIDENFGDGNNLSINSAGSSVVHSNSSTASNNHSSTHTTSPQTIVKLTPAQTSSGSARTSSPIVNVSSLKKFTTRDEPSTSRTPDMPPFALANVNAGNTGMKFAYEQQQQPQQPSTAVNTTSTPAGLVINTNIHTLKESPPSSPGSEASAKKRRKQIQNSSTPQPSPHGHVAEINKEKDSKIVLQNGGIPLQTHHHMLGNSINPTSLMAKSMTETLNQEIESHMMNSTDSLTSSSFIGPQYPGRKDSTKSTASSTTTTMSGPASLTSMLSGTTTANGTPQSLEQLLERQWEQGSQFLMEQAQHFDIASLLSCLHQLKIENSRLEDHINSLVSRRDHLLAVNARLAIPLGQQPPTAPGLVNNGPQPQPENQPPPQQPTTNTTNKRQAPANPISTIQISPLENGLDYRGHNQTQISSQSNNNSNSNSGSNIRHSTTVVKGGGTTHVVTIDTPNSNPQHPQHQYHNAQYQQQVYQHQQQAHVNSVRGRQGNSFQSQSVPNVFPSVPKSKN